MQCVARAASDRSGTVEGLKRKGVPAACVGGRDADEIS